DRVDDFLAAVRAVAARVELRAAREAVVVDDDAALVELHAAEVPDELAELRLPDREQHEVRFDLVLAGGDRLLVVVEPHAAQALDVLAAFERDRLRLPRVARALDDRRVVLVLVAAHVRAHAAIDHRHARYAEADELAQRVDRRVAAADDDR